MRQIGDGSGAYQLDRDVAERGGLNGAGYDAAACGIGSELVEEIVLAAAAYDAQLREFCGGERFERFQHYAIF